MIVGAVIDDKGQPICCEMWPGNTADVAALLPVVERLKKGNLRQDFPGRWSCHATYDTGCGSHTAKVRRQCQQNPCVFQLIEMTG